VKDVPVHAMRTYGDSEGIDALILNLTTTWRRVVKFKLRPL